MAKLGVALVTIATCGTALANKENRTCGAGQEWEPRCQWTSLNGCIGKSGCRHCGGGDHQVLCKADREDRLNTLNLPTRRETYYLTNLTDEEKETAASLSQQDLQIFCEVPASVGVWWQATCEKGGLGCRFGGVWHQCQECPAGQESDPRCQYNTVIGCTGNGRCRHCGNGVDQVRCKAEREQALEALNLPRHPEATLTWAQEKIAAQLSEEDLRILCEIPGNFDVAWKESCVDDSEPGCNLGNVHHQCFGTIKAVP